MFMGSAAFLHAQVSDTVIVDSPVAVEVDTDTDDSGNQNEYFLQLSEYDSLSVQTRNVPDSVLQGYEKNKSFWYAQRQAEKGDRNAQRRYTVRDNSENPGRTERNQQRQTYEPKSSPTWLQTLMWIIIIGGFAGALAYYLATNKVTLFRKKEKKLSGDNGDDSIPENIFAINYQQEIDKAAAQGNYRLAIRLMYLRSLRNLSEKNIIQYKQDRTNFDYLLQLQPTAYYKDFFRITRHYEYSWYGEFNVAPDAYTIIRNEFDQFEKITG